MLEQYRKDLPMEEKDLLSDHEQMSKRKLLFVVAGAAFAFVFFLFLIGIFRSDADSLAVNESKPDAIPKEALVSLEEKLQAIIVRLDALEKTAPTQHDLPIATLEVSEPRFEQATALSTTSISSTEDAIAMTDQALRSFVHNEAQETVVLEEAIPKKESVAKSSKSKAKKSKEKTAVAVGPNSPTYVVQKGDTLSKISMRYFGTANRWKAIYDANRNRIANINQLKVGTALVIPQESKQ